MNRCFVDTTALYAILDADDLNHPAARKTWTGLLRDDTGLVTTNYVLVETSALVQHRLGLKAVRVFEEDIYPVLHVKWLDRELHEAGVATVLSAARRRLSLVDCVSFDIMRRDGIHRAFTFDRHFTQQGFTCLPGT